MGHRNKKTTIKFYLSKRCTVDLQSLFHGREPDYSHIELLRGKTLHRDANAPLSLTSDQMEMVRKEYELLGPVKVRKSRNGPCPPDCSHCEYRRERNKIMMVLARKMRKKVRTEYFLGTASFDSSKP